MLTKPKTDNWLTKPRKDGIKGGGRRICWAVVSSSSSARDAVWQLLWAHANRKAVCQVRLAWIALDLDLPRDDPEISDERELTDEELAVEELRRAQSTVLAMSGTTLRTIVAEFEAEGKIMTWQSGGRTLIQLLPAKYGDGTGVPPRASGIRWMQPVPPL
jgi:hypothetical protein